MTKQDTFADKVKTFGRRTLAHAANIKYGRPAKKLKLIGVTGSKGKTTTTLLIYHILRQNGLAAGCISSISAKVGDQDLDTGFHVTSPEPWELPKYLKQMVDAGIEYVVLEATSNGLQQGRFAGLQFEVAVITNIDSDHLDYHVNWQNYAEAKFKLFELLQSGGLAVINADHQSGGWIRERAQSLETEVYASWFSASEAQNFEQSFAGMNFNYDGVQFVVNAFGLHMLENILAAAKACSRYLGVEAIATALQSYQTPPGRLEVLQTEPFTIIVDFAHTPNSLERSLEAIYELKQLDSRIITVFGCAGDRDPSRRLMGVPAAKFSKLVVLTAEDPRNENLAEINSEIFSHAQPLHAVLLERFGDHSEYENSHFENLFAKIKRVIDNNDVPFIAFDEMSVNARADAISFAMKFARSGDIVFITGKGHEKSLAFFDTEFEWSDQAIVQKALAGK